MYLTTLQKELYMTKELLLKNVFDLIRTLSPFFDKELLVWNPDTLKRNYKNKKFLDESFYASKET